MILSIVFIPSELLMHCNLLSFDNKAARISPRRPSTAAGCSGYLLSVPALLEPVPLSVPVVLPVPALPVPLPVFPL